MKKFFNLIIHNFEKIVFFICVALVIYVRIRLLKMPLDRDEGSWAYAGWLILNGNPPFTYHYDAKMPGLYYLYAFFQLLFGQTGEGVRTGILLFILLNIFLVYKVAIKLTDNSKNALIAASLFSIFTLDTKTLSLSGYSSHFVLTFVMIGIIFLFNAFKNKNIYYFWAGVSIGTSFLMKQQAIFYFLFFLIYIIFYEIYSKNNMKYVVKKFFYFISGFFIVFLLTCFLMKIQNVFEKFWFMTVIYPLTPAYKLSFESIWNNFLIFLEISSVFFKTVFLLCIIYFFYFMIFNKETTKKIFYSFIFLASIFFSFHGFIFRTHYFIVWFLLAALLMSENSIEKLNKFRNFLLIFLLCILIITQYNYLFKINPYMFSRYLYSFNLFSESPRIAEFIKNNTDKEDKIAILGSEPQILFYAKRKSATGYLFGDQLMAENKIAENMQEEAICEIEKSKPEYLIFANIPTAWSIKFKSSKKIFQWFEEKKKTLEPVLAVNFYSLENVEYITDKQEILKFKTPYFIIVYKYN